MISNQNNFFFTALKHLKFHISRHMSLDTRHDVDDFFSDKISGSDFQLRQFLIFSHSIKQLQSVFVLYSSALLVEHVCTSRPFKLKWKYRKYLKRCRRKEREAWNVRERLST